MLVYFGLMRGWGKLVTLKDIATRAGVSEATVSRALRGNHSISEATRQRIQELARQMGHTENRLAKGLALRRTNTVGVVLPELGNIWFGQLSWMMAKHFATEGYACITPLQQPHESVLYLAETRVDGIVLWGDGLVQDRTPQELAFLGTLLARTPAVCIAADLTHIGVPSVDVDRHQAIGEVVKLLVNRGHRRIAFVGRVDSMRGSTQQKAMGYTEAMESYGLPALLVDCPLDERTALDNTEAILLHTRPTALVAENNSVARGLQAGCWRLGIRIPEDLSLVGYDNTTREGRHSDLTTIGPDSDQMARVVAETLVARMERVRRSDKATPRPAAGVRQIPWRWHEGGSVADPTTGRRASL